jgi:hypothetical protein
MIIIFNLIGLGMLIGAATLAGFFVMIVGCKINEEWVLSHAMLAGMVAYGFFMIVLDIWYRMTRGKRSQVFEGLENTKGSLIHPRAGGQLGFIPIWIWGVFFIVGQLYVEFGGKADVSARQSNPYAARASVSQDYSYPGIFDSFTASSETPISALKLGMISGVDPHRIATINGQPFAAGESHKLTFGKTQVTVQCTEIREQSVMLTMSDDAQPHELKTGERLVRLGKGWAVSQRRD